MCKHAVQCWSRLCIYLLARPPPGGRLGMFSVAMLLRTDTRSGTPASPQFPSSSTNKRKEDDGFLRCQVVHGGQIIVYYKPRFKRSTATFLWEINSSGKKIWSAFYLQHHCVQQTDFKYLYYLKNVYFVLAMSTETEHSMGPLVSLNLFKKHFRTRQQKDGWAQRTA